MTALDHVRQKASVYSQRLLLWSPWLAVVFFAPEVEDDGITQCTETTHY